MKCIKCGANAEKGSLYCKKCNPLASKKKRVCLLCKTELADDANFCPKCGTKVDFFEHVIPDQDNQNIISAKDENNSSIQKFNLGSTKQSLSQEVIGNRKKSENSKLVFIALCAFILMSIFYLGNKSNHSSTPESKTAITKDNYELDFADEKVFEAALNNGQKVKEKVVKFTVDDYKPDSALGINCWAGEHLNFISEDELDVKNGDAVVAYITEEPSNILGSWSVKYQVIDIEHKMTETKGDEQSSSTNENKDDGLKEENSDVKKIEMTIGAASFRGMNVKEAAGELRRMGFKNIEYDVIQTDSESSDDTIVYVSITEGDNSNRTFAKTDKFDQNSIITLVSYEYKKPTVSSNDEKKEPVKKKNPVSYSTNDSEAVKNGNTGVFSYKKSGSYDIYYIIDFDEGYVYRFIEGNGDTIGDRLKIESGDLNDTLIITYHDGDDVWSNGLHFKYKNQPNHLILEDDDHFEYDFQTTDLDDALKIKDSKTFYDY